MDRPIRLMSFTIHSQHQPAGKYIKLFVGQTSLNFSVTWKNKHMPLSHLTNTETRPHIKISGRIK